MLYERCTTGTFWFTSFCIFSEKVSIYSILINRLLTIAHIIKVSKSYFSFLAEVEGIAEEGSLLNAVNKLIETTETENREKALNDLRNIIIEKHQIFDNFDMHDAQEFLQILLQNLAVSFMTYNCNKYLQNNI